LPCVADHQRGEEIEPAKVEPVVRGTETILLVEDEHAVRRAAAEYLGLRGYTILEAKDGLEALERVKNHKSAIDLVVTDVVMPNMSGGQLATELSTLRPETILLFVSGYAGKTVLDHNVIDLETNFLQKPYTLKQLAGKVRAALDPKRESLIKNSN